MANLATILVVEDTPANIKLVTMLLEKTASMSPTSF